MADFCRQCCVEVLGLPPEKNDLQGLVTAEDFAKGYFALAICEGCSGGAFAPDGSCLGCKLHPPDGKEV